MLQVFDLAGVAESIDTPYRPWPVADLPGLSISVVVAEGPANWFRQVSHAELLLVLEGVVTLDAQGGKVVLNEGELASAEANARHHMRSGMRSTVLLCEEVKAGDQANGHHVPETDLAGNLDKSNPAVAVRSEGTFTWLDTGAAGRYEAHATRLMGASAPYIVPAGHLAVVVYRGVLDFSAEGPDATPASGTVVGSQMLLAAADTRLLLTSERGATVVVLARRGAALPESAAPAASRSDRPEP